MATSRSKPWKSKWQELERLGRGGQGTTFRVALHGSAGTQINYVLKILNDQTKMERRGRMYREVATLKTLDHPRIPKVIDTNADAFEDLTQDLFLVTTFIPGPTLEAYVDRPSSISLEEATKLAINLAEILIYCHSKGVIHRDIKPDNIILRNDSTDDPGLLDFGLSFNQETDAGDGLTPSAQQLGNRFLALPELQLKSANKRDHRSDLTQLCGIFLYTLTSEHPVTLIDDQSRLPHQRPRAAAFLASLSPEIRTRLNRLFDVGFAVHIDQRFQSAQALREDLLFLTRTSDAQQGGSVEEMLNSIRERLADQQKPP
jgi:serine/threonine protein kinase